MRKAPRIGSGAKHTRGRCYERDFQHPGAGGHNHTHRRMVMKRLKDLDEVAYVRFASVYRSFKDINTFMEELKSLLGESEENKDDSAENPKAD